MSALPLSGLILALLLGWAVVAELIHGRIGNAPTWGVLALWAAGLGAAVVLPGSAGFPWPALWIGAAYAAVVLVTGRAMQALRWAERWEVHLCAAACLWFGAQADGFLLATAVAGGVMSLAMPMLAAVPAPSLPAVAARWRRPPSRASSIPYAPAIATGAVFASWMR
ncbi:hypothetical protein [Uliginosibacterium sp. H1]|uniref:hypothetical protein n=1 Tax=Uliginosibacterium sp. H1 TaxID=3114757 RepID=UPI002E16E0BA|nr:hypothetical protein [Uliginosibacterium sp. H1]